jgi:hypothetical protein
VTGASWDLSEYLKRTKSEHWKADVSFKNRVDVPRGPDGQFGFDIESKARGNFVASITPGALRSRVLRVPCPTILVLPRRVPCPTILTLHSKSL